jgi:hypothetical protein
MGMTAERLTAEMGVEEYFEHWADYLIAPWGDRREGPLFADREDEAATRKKFIEQQNRKFKRVK